MNQSNNSTETEKMLRWIQVKNNPDSGGSLCHDTPSSPFPWSHLIRPKDAIDRPAKLARGRRPLRVLDRGRIFARRALERRRDLVEEQLVAEADGRDEAAVGRPVLR